MATIVNFPTRSPRRQIHICTLATMTTAEVAAFADAMTAGCNGRLVKADAEGCIIEVPDEITARHLMELCEEWNFARKAKEDG